MMSQVISLISTALQYERKFHTTSRTWVIIPDGLLMSFSLAGQEHTFLRFTKDGFYGAVDAGSPEMSYSADAELGTMTWSGDPQTQVTFKLMPFVKIYEDRLGSMFGNDPVSTQYRVNNDESKQHSIVIDQIDVRYKKKTTPVQEL